MADFDFGNLIGELIGGGLSAYGAYTSAEAAADAAANFSAANVAAADSALTAAEPYGVMSPGGSFSFDADKKTGTAALSPELEEYYKGALGRAGLWGGMVTEMGLDPWQTATTFYNQQQNLMAPQEEKLRTDLETRLLSQGRLGSTGGQAQQKVLEDSILAGQDERQMQAFTRSQNLINSLLGRESADIGTALQMLDVPMQLGNLGRGVGGTLGSAAAYGLGSRTDANKALAQSTAYSPFGTSLSQLGGLFSTSPGSSPSAIRSAVSSLFNPRRSGG